MKKNLIKYGTSFLLGGGLFCFYLYTHEFPAAKALDNYRLLSDAAAIPGLLLTMFGALVWAGSIGATDGVSYALDHVFRALIPGVRGGQEEETYADFVARRREKYGKSRGYVFLVVTGMVFLAISVLFVVLFYVV